MSQTNMQKAYQLLIFVMLIGLSVSRPNGAIENQEPSDQNQLGITDIEKSYPFYRPMQSLQYFNYDEPSTSDKYQLQYRSFYPGNPFGNVRGGGSGGNANFPVWDPYRQLVSKRQTRYRQCYFNPISCFRK